ncbi:uncharacterized protein LOC124849618 [Scophthalmus maximus]|uniref:uncharacterized protein LOC124849618 n=1 Tax=Scophthalmus maximus TaxID=52904 RepID=UPI001FA90E4F|nr:uncharacterized protein LOC124849618 [Scophthalmus maximus]
MDAPPEDTIQAGVTTDEVEGASRNTKIKEVSQTTSLGDLDLRSSEGLNQNQDTTTHELVGSSDASHSIPSLISQKAKSMSSVKFIQLSHDSTFEKTLSFRPNQPENEAVFLTESTPDIEASRLRSCLPESVSETTGEPYSSVHHRSSSPECLTDTAILLTESRVSSPESALSINGLNVFALDSPVPQFRPLSPLPPPVFPWETSDRASAQGQPLLSPPGGTSLLLSSEAEERPLTPMVSNKKPFGRPVSLCSDYSSEIFISPQSLTFDIEDRTSSPESVILETKQWLFTCCETVTASPDFNDMRSSSHESIGSITAHWLLPPDSPIPEFRHAVSDSFMTCEYKSSSPESVFSDKDFDTGLLLTMSFEDRPSSPESAASVNEYKALSPDSAVPKFSFNWPDKPIVMIGERSISPESVCSDVEYGSMSPTSLSPEKRSSSPATVKFGDESEYVLPVTGHTVPSTKLIESSQIEYDSTSVDQKPKSPEAFVFDIRNKPTTTMELGSEYDDEWVMICLSDIDKRQPSPKPVSYYRPVSPQPVTLGIRASSPVTETLKESVLSDTEYETGPLLSHFKDMLFPPNSSGSIINFGSLSNPVADLSPEEDKALQPTYATIYLEDTFIAKQFEAKSNVIVDLEKLRNEEKSKSFVLSKSLEENPKKYSETEAPKVQLAVPGVRQSDILTPLAGAKDFSTAFQSVKLDYGTVQNVTKYQNESSQRITKPHNETQASDQTLSQEIASYDLPLSLALITTVPKDQNTPRESSMSVSQHHVPLCSTEYSVPVCTLMNDAKLWKLISQIRDPQYIGNPSMSETGVFQFAETMTESNQTNSDKAVGDETAGLRSESNLRPLLPDSEAEYRPVSQGSLGMLESFRQDSSHSGRSVGSQLALTPDSPIPQYLNSFPVLYHRSVSTESALSDRELETNLNISFLYEDRPASPDSVSSINIYRALSVDSPISEFRQSSPDSVNVDRPLSPESCVPVFWQTLPELSVSTTLERSLSPVSEGEYGAMSLSQHCSEMRPSSQDSVMSGDNNSGDLPIPKFKTGLTKSVLGSAHRSSSPKSGTSDIEWGQSSKDIVVSKQRPDSPESTVSETTERVLGASSQILRATHVPVYKFVYDAELRKLISQICDLHYIGETFCSKTGFFEFTRTRTEKVLKNSDVNEESEDSMKLDITDPSDADVLQAAQAKIEGEERPVSPYSESEYRPLSAGELTLISKLTSDSPEFLKDLSPDSPVPQFSGEYSPQSPVSDEESDLCIPCLFNEIRPSSPISLVSSDENRAFPIDLHLPDFTPAVSGPVTPSVEYRPSSPESVHSDIEYQFSTSDDFTDQRVDSPESAAFILEEKQSTAGTFRENQLIRQLYDHQYVEVFECVDNGKEHVLLDPDAEETGRPKSPDPETKYQPLLHKSLKSKSVLTHCQEMGNSEDKYRSLSTDLPIPQSSVSVSQSENHTEASSGPKSVAPELEDSSESDIEERRGPPDSVTSEIEIRPISPEFVMEYMPVSPQSPTLTTDIRTSYLDSKSVNKFRSLLPDSPLPQLSQNIESLVLVEGNRSSTPLSVISDTETDVPDMSFVEAQQTSFTSDSENELRALSPDSSKPVFRQAILNPTLLIDEFRSTSPGSVCYTDIECENGSFPSVSNEHRSQSPDSVASRDENQALSSDPPIPQYIARQAEPFPSFAGFRSASPESATSDVEYAPLINSPLDTENRPDSPESFISEVENRPLSPDSESEYRHLSPTLLMLTSNFRSSSRESIVSLNEFRALSPDSPIPVSRQETSITYMEYRSSSPESVLSDFEVEMDLPFSMLFEDRPSSPESLSSVSKNIRLSPDSPILEFTPAFAVPYVSSYRSASPQSVASDMEFAPFMLQLLDDKGRPDSPQSVLSFSEYHRLSPESPIPHYTPREPFIFTVNPRFSSPGSFFSNEDLETDMCVPWLFGDRAASSDSTPPKDEFGPLSPDSPFPEFTQSLQESFITHMHSDLEMELPLPTFLESRPLSPEFQASIRLSPDSPVPDFMPPMFELPKTIFGNRSTSPKSACSDIEYIVISLESQVYDNRPASPGSGASVDEYHSLSPDSPIPEYRPAVPECVIVNVGYRSYSPESIESGVERGFGEFLMSTNYGVENRQDSPESKRVEEQVRLLSMESIPLECKPLSPDSPFPSFTQDVLETKTTETSYGHLSPSSKLSTAQYNVAYSASFDIDVADMRKLSTQSDRSEEEFKHLSPESPKPNFAKTTVGYLMTVRDLSPTEFSDSNNFTQTLGRLCAEDRSSPESIESDKEKLLLEPKSSITESKVPTATEATIDNAGLSTTIVPSSPEESAVLVAEYNLINDVQLWKLISQVRDPQYSGETFSSKTGFLQFIGSKVEYERSVPDGKQDKVNDWQAANATGPQSEVTDPFTTTEAAMDVDGFSCTLSAQIISDTPALESPPPMIETFWSPGAVTYRETKYTFEIPSANSDNEWEFVSVSDTEVDDLRYSPESLIDYRPMSYHSAMSLESLTSVNEFRPLSPDSPLPEFTTSLPECVTFLRSASSSPETLASDIDYMLVDLETQLAGYIPMSLESAMLADKRASSPESMAEFNENRSLSPDSPIPQFTVSLEECTTTHRSSSPESMSSDSDCELMLTSSRAAEIERPSSPESFSSIDEFKRLLPDSPIPEFMRILSSYFMDATPFERSSSPGSLSSDFEFDAFPNDCWIDDSARPLSPQSVELEEELGFCCEDTNRLVSKQKLLSYVTSSLLPELDSSILNKNQMTVSPLIIQNSETISKEVHTNPECQIRPVSDTRVISYDEWKHHGSEAESITTLQTTACEEDFRKDFTVKYSPVQDVKKKEEEILHICAGEPKNKTANQRDPPQTPEETKFQTDDEVLFASTATEDPAKIDVLLSENKPMKPFPLQLLGQNSNMTHQTVTQVLPLLEKTFCVMSDRLHGYSEWELSTKEAQSSELFSPTSSQFLVPPDYEAVFSGHQTLKVPECCQASLNDLSPVSPVFSDSAQVVAEVSTKKELETAEDFDFSPDFNRVLSEFKKTVSELESEEPKDPAKELSMGSESPQHSDSDMEFFDCRQAFSDFSESEDVKLEPEISYHISDPSSPMPGSSPDIGFVKGNPRYTSHPFLQVEDYKGFSSGSESLGEFAYDSEGSRECRTERDLPECEELPSRDQAGYFDDDDFLGRVMLSMSVTLHWLFAVVLPSRLKGLKKQICTL